MVFSTQNNDAAWASQRHRAVRRPLDKGLFDQRVPGRVHQGRPRTACTVDGTVYCLRNDLAQTVLWYNKTLMDQFGYTVPTTWEEYQALGDEGGDRAPGYIVGAVGDSWTPEVYFWGGQAPDEHGHRCRRRSAPTRPTRRRSPWPSCSTRLNDARVLAQESVFSPEFVKKHADKVLMLPGPVVVRRRRVPERGHAQRRARQIDRGRAALRGTARTRPTGNVGGGTWFVVPALRATSRRPRTSLTFVTSDDDYQVDLAPGFPAYAAAADKWLAKQEESGLLHRRLRRRRRHGRHEVWAGWGYPRFSQEAIWAKTVTPELAGGESLVDLLPTWQTAIKNQAQVERLQGQLTCRSHS